MCSVIAVELGLKYHKKFIVIQWYRQWQLLNNVDPESWTSEAQKIRLLKVVEMWKNLSEHNEVHLVGDINIDNALNINGYKKDLIDIIEENILQTG